MQSETSGYNSSCGSLLNPSFCGLHLLLLFASVDAVVTAMGTLAGDWTSLILNAY